MAEATMREVVGRLRAENSAAMLELREFKYALDDVAKNVEQLAVASEEIHLSLTGVGAPLKGHTGRLSAHATQVVLAFRAARVAVLSWNIAGGGRPPHHRSAMRGAVERLRAEKSKALVELLDFDLSLDQLLQSVGLLAVAAGELHVAVQNRGTPDSIEGYRQVGAMRERADRLSTRSTQVLFDFRTLLAAVGRWNIIDSGGSSNEPRGSRRPWPN